jgi:hypothetical protein
MIDRIRASRALYCMVVLLVAGLVAGGLVVFAGCQSDTQTKQQEFKAKWTKIIQELEAKVSQDDKKGQDLVAKNDLAGVIALSKQRLTYIDDTLGKLLELYPPQDLRKLDVLSTYYLITVKDRLEQQILLYDAILNNRPTTDIKTVLDTLIARNQTIGRELGIELQTHGIDITPGGQQTTPKSTPTTPSSSPSTSP